jgi:DNA polymerase Ligase (LigD)
MQNHLIETASHATGSMLVWDTGEYSILPWREPQQSQASSDEESDSADHRKSTPMLSESEKLHIAFQQNKFRLRLHGTRLPQNYSVSLRLDKDSYHKEQPARPKRRRRKLSPKVKQAEMLETSDSEGDNGVSSSASTPPTYLAKADLRSLQRRASLPLKDASTIRTQLPAHDSQTDADSDDPSVPPPQSQTQNPTTALSHPPAADARSTTAIHSDHASNPESESETIRLTNTYPGGALNTISSIHQRRWFLSLDRRNSGFVPQKTPHSGRKKWVRKWKSDGSKDGFDPFHVLGREMERSVVTGRLAAEILADEGVVGFVPRAGWRGVMD